MQCVGTTDGAAAVEALRAELAQAKEQARASNAAALGRRIESRTGCSSPKRGKDSQNGY